jgi:hypothetical protein
LEEYLNLSHRKLNGFDKQKQEFAHVTTVSSKPLCSSLKVAYRIAKCERPHLSLVLPAATDRVEIIFGESRTKELWKFPLADNTLERRIFNISEHHYDHKTD